MLPNFVPAGTSVASFFERVLPEAHRTAVPADASAGELAILVRIETGDGYLYSIRGRDVSVTRADKAEAHLVLTTTADALAFFLADWSGPRRFAPSFVPAQGVRLITDPRVVKRLAQATGKIELLLTGLEAGDARLVLSAAGGKKHRENGRPADAAIETKVSVFEELLGGRLLPDEAITAAHVSVRGKKLVALQFAFAVAPFFPVK
jgi:putative sterol carrier protein